MVSINRCAGLGPHREDDRSHPLAHAEKDERGADEHEEPLQRRPGDVRQHDLIDGLVDVEVVEVRVEDAAEAVEEEEAADRRQREPTLEMHARG